MWCDGDMSWVREKHKAACLACTNMYNEGRGTPWSCPRAWGQRMRQHSSTPAACCRWRRGQPIRTHERGGPRTDLCCRRSAGTAARPPCGALVPRAQTPAALQHVPGQHTGHAPHLGKGRPAAEAAVAAADDDHDASRGVVGGGSGGAPVYIEPRPPSASLPSCSHRLGWAGGWQQQQQHFVSQQPAALL